MIHWFWPIVTGKTFYDTSTVIHFAAWIFIGSGPAYMRWSYLKGLAVCMGLALAWEVFEGMVCEPRWPLLWKHPESWLNRWGSDPLTCVVGVACAYWLVRRQ